MAGTIYILSNPAIPDLIKIGKTKQDPAKRANDLYTSGVPLPFEVEIAVTVKDPDACERALHKALEPLRRNPEREFFETTVDHIRELLEYMAIDEKDITKKVASRVKNMNPEGTSAARQYKRRPPLDFVEMGIPPKSILQALDLKKKKTEKTATVLDSKMVLFQGERMSLSEATMLVHERTYAVRPTPYWKYKNKNLFDIYVEVHERKSKLAKDQAKAFKKRPPLNFQAMRIPRGSILQALDREGNPTGETAAVIDSKNVLFRKKRMMLSDATKLTHKRSYNVRPTPHWKYGNKTLFEIYEKTHKRTKSR